MDAAKQVARLRDQMLAFLGNLQGPPKTARRFVAEALWGICARRSLRLSEIARSLAEPIALIKTENRLSRQAAREGLAQALTDFVVEHGAPRVGRDTLLVIDLSDLSKKYATKMEHIGRVRDGSQKELANGYWLCGVVAVECGGHRITPLVNHLWSTSAPGHLSENDEVLQCIARVAAKTGDNGIWVMDRGGDRMSLFECLIPAGRRFLVRLNGTRHLLHRGRAVLASELAAQCPLRHIEHVTRQRADGTEHRVELRYGMMPVALPGFEAKPLWMLVVHGFGEKPLMILTTEPLSDSRRSQWWALEAYLTRWRIEDTLRFAKQTYALEDVRVLGYQSLKNMMALALLAMSFTMQWLDTSDKLAVLVHHAIEAGKRLFGVPDFRYYAVADGMAELLRRRTKAPFEPHRQPLTTDPQLDMLAFSDA